MAAMMAVTTMVTRNNGGALAVDRKGWFPEIALPWSSEAECNRRLEFPRRAPLFASVGLNVSAGAPREQERKGGRGPADNCDVARQLAAAEAELQDGEAARKKQQQQKGRKKKLGGGGGLLALRKVRVKVGNPHLRRLLSGAIAGAVSRTFVAPLETIRTHLMVGSCSAGSMGEVFQWIMRTEGWTGLFRGNAVNVLRVAPSKAIEASSHTSPRLRLLLLLSLNFF
ncbi:hypothetical protein ABZP36_022424 [Zizania latifolia]